MLLAIIRYIKGYLRIRIVGYSPERFLNLCIHHHIYLWGLQPHMHNYEMYISVNGFRKLKPIIKKTKTKVVIVNRYGLPFFLHKYRKRKVFFAGAAGCMISIWLMSTIVWNIHIEGNYSRTDEVILEYLETKEVHHGMRKSEIDCEQIVKDIRKKFDDIIWVSASIEGTRLLIQVKENTDTITQEMSKDEAVSDLVATQDGEIVKMITRTGTPMVSVGDKIKKGDILVSGRVEIKNDGGEVTEYRYQSADADIAVKVKEPYEKSKPVYFEKKIYTGKRRTQYYLQTKNYYGTAGITKNKFQHADTFTSEKQLVLGEHFLFPIAYGKKEIKEYRLKREKWSEKELQKMLSEEFNLFCRDLTKKGVEIIEKDVRIYNGQKMATARGTLVLVKPAYKKNDTEIIQIENKETNTEGVN